MKSLFLQIFYSNVLQSIIFIDFIAKINVCYGELRLCSWVRTSTTLSWPTLYSNCRGICSTNQKPEVQYKINWNPWLEYKIYWVEEYFISWPFTLKNFLAVQKLYNVIIDLCKRIKVISAGYYLYCNCIGSSGYYTRH